MHGLYLWWWVQERHVPLPAVAAILAAGDLAITVLEVPTGWIADRVGHRLSLVAGSVFQIAGMLVAWLGGGVSGVLAASVLIAIGDAFRSGADQALLYRSCAATDRESAFQSIVARTDAVQLVALVVMVLTGGAIVRVWGFAAAWAAETSLCAAGLVIACAMIEPPPAAATPEDEATESAAAAANGCSSLFALILPASLLGAIAGAATFLAQTDATMKLAEITVIVAVVTLAEAAGALLAARMTPGNRTQLLLAAGGVVLAAAAALHPALISAVAIALSFMTGLAYPLRAASIQRAASDDVRARAASTASACDKAAATIALAIAGALPRGKRGSR